MNKSVYIFLFAYVFLSPLSYGRDTQGLLRQIFGASSSEKFSFHEPTYFVFGDDDLKLQFGFKYRLLKNNNLYFAYTQLMFWEIYDESKPFKDVNYRPELFYRLVESDSAFSSLDAGYMHHSNGQDREDSRSLDRIFIRATFLNRLNRHYIGSVVKIYNIYNEDDTNKDIVNHLGYWEIMMFITDIATINENSIDLSLRTYAGSKGYDIDQGGNEFGLIYNFVESSVNPSIYLQWFEGFAENLLSYKKKRSELRLGLFLSF